MATTDQASTSMRRVTYKRPACEDCGGRLRQLRGARVSGVVTVYYFECAECGARYRADS
jgi:uncharacterized protein with PIN domain